MAAINRRNRVGFAAFTGVVVLVTGCSHFSGTHWPWGHKAPAPPVAVNELDESGAGAAAAAYPQYWKRNTLLVDLREAVGEGSLVLTPRAGTQWPVRLAFRVTPGAIGVLEVRGAQRLVLAVAAQGSQPIDLELVPGVYTATTAQITVRWAAR
jgi:hypothetical protein